MTLSWKVLPRDLIALATVGKEKIWCDRAGLGGIQVGATFVELTLVAELRRSTVDQQTANSRPTVGRQLADSILWELFFTLI